MGDEPTIDAEVVDDGAMLPAVVDGTPGALLALAVQKDLDIEKLQKLMELQERWEANQARKAFYAALSAFQAAVPPLAKDAVVDFTSPKGRTYYKHASLPAIAEAIRKPMETHGLCYRFRTDTEDGKVRVTCMVTHVAGHSEETSMTAPADTSGNKNAIQSLGSGITYLRRYTLVAALGLTTADEDTDGRQDRGGAPQQPQATTRRPAAPVHPWKPGDRPTVTVKSLQAEDKWEDRPQGKKAKWFLAVTSDGVDVWCKTESNPASKIKKAQWAAGDSATHLVDDVDFKDGKFFAKVSEVRPVPVTKPGGALLDSVLAYKDLLLLRDWKIALDACQTDEPDESTPPALLMKLQEALERLHQGAEAADEPPVGGEDAHGLPDDDPGHDGDVPF